MLIFEGGGVVEVVGSPRKRAYALVFEGGRGGGVGKEQPSQPWQQRSHNAVGRPQGDNLTILSRKPTRPNHEKYHVTVDRARLLMISRCYRATRVVGGNCWSSAVALPPA
jgi:hypothetical protein